MLDTFNVRVLVALNFLICGLQEDEANFDEQKNLAKVESRLCKFSGNNKLESIIHLHELVQQTSIPGSCVASYQGLLNPKVIDMH